MRCAGEKLVYLLGCLAILAHWPQSALAAPTQEVIMNEQVTTTYRPMQRHVVVPIREYRTRTWTHGWWNPFTTPRVVNYHIPETRWEERMETSYVPVPQRRYVAEMRTTETPAPALVLATPPTIIKPLPMQPMQPTTQIATRPRQMLDNPPIVAVPRASEANIRQAAIPSARTTIVTRDNDRGPRTVRPFTGHKRRSPAPGQEEPRAEENSTFPFR